MSAPLVYVTFASRLSNLLELVKAEAAFIHSDFWSQVKRTPSLDMAHHKSIYDECEESSSLLLAHLTECIRESLSETKADELLHRNYMYKIHCEVSQASMLEPHEEAAMWDIWEAQDRQSAEDERIAMYRNEY